MSVLQHKETFLINFILFYFFNFFNVYLFLRQRETEHEWRRVREKGRHRIWNRLQALSCQHRARCRARTHGPWDHDLSRSQTLNRLSHPGAPLINFNMINKQCLAILVHDAKCQMTTSEPMVLLSLALCLSLTAQLWVIVSHARMLGLRPQCLAEISVFFRMLEGAHHWH